jgi:heat shock protein HslJ
MTYLRSLVALTLAASLGAGCSESMSTPTSSSSISASPNLTVGELAGTWNLLSIQAAGQAAQATPAGATYTLSFADGRLSTRADCNVCGGTFSLSGQTLTAGPALACTRAACRTMDFESTYTGILGGEGTATLSGATLLLSSERGTLHFTR